jgi:uncharacterized membrane protein (UPF0127 family)
VKAFGVTLALTLWAGGALADCAIDRVDLRGDWGQARFTVELADDAAERAQGLMFRESLPRAQGMLFVYNQPQRAVFWMKNTLIPLDMIFLDGTGTVTHIHENAVPLDETGIDGGAGVVAVLEINGGLSRQLGLEVGSELRHPALEQAAAAWACD